MHILLSWLVLSLSVWVAARVLSGLRIHAFGDALIVAMIFGLLNYLLGHFLYVIIGTVTLGFGFVLSFITRVVVDALLLKLTGLVTKRVEVRSFGTALLAALIIAGLSALGEFAITKMSWIHSL